MAKGIKVSEKHGVNPSLTVCFFCGKEKGIAMLGKLKGDVKAPKKMIADYEPCSECAEKFKQGILWIEVQDTPLHEDMFEIATGVYPTGRYVVTTEDILDKLNGVEQVRKTRRALVDKEMYEALTGGNKNGRNKDKV